MPVQLQRAMAAEAEAARNARAKVATLRDDQHHHYHHHLQRDHHHHRTVDIMFGLGL